MLLYWNCGDSYHLDIAKSINQEHPNSVSLVATTNREILQAAKKKNLEALDISFIFQSRFLLPKINEIKICSQNVFRKLQECENLFYRIADRHSIVRPSTTNLRLIYCLTVSYLYKILISRKIETVFFHSTPHFAPCVALFYLCKEVLNIKTVICYATLVEKRIILTEDFRQPLLNQEALNTPVKFEGYNIFEESSIEKFIKTFNTSSIATNKTKVTISIAVFFKIVHYFLRKFRPKGFIKRVKGWVLRQNKFSDRSIFYYDPTRNATSRYYDFIANIKLLRLCNFYRSLTIDFSSLGQKPFAYMGLHVQPERTSLPEGGHYNEQYLAVLELSKSLPKGWVLLVKEHPAQFNLKDLRKYKFRSKFFYESIARIPNVHLIDTNVSSKILLEKQKLQQLLLEV